MQLGQTYGCACVARPQRRHQTSSHSFSQDDSDCPSKSTDFPLNNVSCVDAAAIVSSLLVDVVAWGRWVAETEPPWLGMVFLWSLLEAAEMVGLSPGTRWLEQDRIVWMGSESGRRSSESSAMARGQCQETGAGSQTAGTTEVIMWRR